MHLVRHLRKNPVTKLRPNLKWAAYPSTRPKKYSLQIAKPWKAPLLTIDHWQLKIKKAFKFFLAIFLLVPSKSMQKNKLFLYYWRFYHIQCQPLKWLGMPPPLYYSILNSCFFGKNFQTVSSETSFKEYSSYPKMTGILFLICEICEICGSNFLVAAAGRAVLIRISPCSSVAKIRIAAMPWGSLKKTRFCGILPS